MVDVASIVRSEVGGGSSGTPVQTSSGFTQTPAAVGIDVVSVTTSVTEYHHPDEYRVASTSGSGKGGHTGAVRRKKRVPQHEDGSEPAKKKQKFKSKEFVNTDEEDDKQVDHSENLTAASKNDGEPTPEYAGNGGSTGAVQGKKHGPKDESSACVMDEDGTQAGPSECTSLKGLENSPESSEASASASEVKVNKLRSSLEHYLIGHTLQVCNACITHGSECSWSVGAENQKRACQACISAKTRCQIEGQPAIRRLRGKVAQLYTNAPEEETDTVKQLVTMMSDRVAELERQQARKYEVKEEMMSRISSLEIQLRDLKAKAKASDV
ncbi:hypothetical protein JVT61DRAFT_9544 [Boletus reticuloceps]|uniref:Uncharacterized protein n=1 Tax=Boletus reticuloceps TaxID=495285 RepID=A0A8I2YGH5_9AGAM|nr:hypothetical protein JVT61DRAFT_9544 [Boletus reticuloceps]